MSLEFKLDNEKVDKRTFLNQTNGEPITIEKVGKLFDNRMFQRQQFILRMSCDTLGIESKIYISPVVKDQTSELLYFGAKSFLQPLLSYALTGEITSRGITLPLSTVREALESNVFTITYDFNGKYPRIQEVH